MTINKIENNALIHAFSILLLSLLSLLYTVHEHEVRYIYNLVRCGPHHNTQFISSAPLRRLATPTRRSTVTSTDTILYFYYLYLWCDHTVVLYICVWPRTKIVVDCSTILVRGCDTDWRRDILYSLVLSYSVVSTLLSLLTTSLVTTHMTCPACIRALDRGLGQISETVRY